MGADSSAAGISGFATYRRVLGYVSPYRWQFALAVIGMLVHSATMAAFAWIMEPMLDGTFVHKNATTILYVSLGIVAIFLFRGIGNFVSVYYMARIGGLVVNRIRSQIFDKYLHLPTSRYDHSSSGELISLVSYNVQSISSAASNAVTILVRDSFAVIALMALMFYQSWKMALGIVILGPIVGVIVNLVSKRFRRISRNIQTSMGRVSHVIEEAVEGQREIKIYGGQHYEQAQFDEVNERNRKLLLKMTKTRASSVPIVQFIIALFLAVIVYQFGQESLHGNISEGEFVSFVTAMLALFAPLKQLTTVNETLQQGIAAGETVFAMLDESSEIDRGSERLPLPIEQIRYDNVSFRYSEDKNFILKDVSLAINAGETVALVGQSGSGKTTLANMLTRMYQLDGQIGCSGRISINNVDINDISLTNLRNGIAYVGQDVKLFNDSVAHNIAYGTLLSSDLNSIREAARLANADGFIQQLPSQYDTMVGENGVLLSGGQRQRLAIARALLKNAPILILDEATSALDTESERKVQDGLNALLSGRTTLVVAHRLSTIEHADKIVVMHDGNIVEVGRHAELLALRGHYAALHSMQFQEEDSEVPA